MRLLLSLALCAALTPGDPFRALSPDEAEAAAAREERALLLAFVTPGSPAAAKLAATCRDERVRSWIGASAVAIEVDPAKEARFARRWFVFRTPTLVFASAQGLELDRLQDAPDAAAFLEATAAIDAGRDAITATRARLGDADDPWLRFDHARALHDQGEMEEALRHFLACWDHGAKLSPPFAAARGAVLDEIVRLARLHPAATDALIERMQERGQKMSIGAASEAEIEEFFELARVLRRGDLLLQLHDALAQRGDATAALRQRFRPHLFEALLDEQRFGEALATLGDAEQEVGRRLAAGVDEGSRRFALHVYEAALAAAQSDLAQRVADRLVAADGSVATWVELVRSARRARSTAVAIALLRRGLESTSLSPREKDELRASIAAFPRLK